MPTSIEAIKTLLGGQKYAPRQVLGAEDFGFSGGAAPTQGELDSPFEQDQARIAAAADARDRAETARVLETNAKVNTYNRPDVTAIREAEEKDALEKLLAPIRLKGQYDVAAAREHAAANAANTQALIGGRERVAGINQGATSARTAASLKSQQLRQRYQNVATGKEKAPVSFLQGLIPGTQAAAQQKLLAEIQAQMDAADAEGAVSPDGEAAPAAAPGGVDPARLARLRAIMAGK